MHPFLRRLLRTILAPAGMSRQEGEHHDVLVKRLQCLPAAPAVTELTWPPWDRALSKPQAVQPSLSSPGLPQCQRSRGAIRPPSTAPSVGGESDHGALAQGIPHLGLPSQPQGPPGRIPSAPETRAFSLRISVDSGRVAPGHEAPHQFDHSSRHFRGRTGPVRQGAHYRPSPAVGHRTEYRGPLPSRFGRRALLGSSSTLKEALQSAASLCLTPGPPAVRRYSVLRLACPNRGHPGILISPNAAGRSFMLCGPGPTMLVPSSGASAPFAQ
ncbi:hypothetical protein NDU88_002276 [Pleurodeles waltl]|uniref:Uncharacterized protein n=1 Tax=Pleurodeles waltl TaxID=8319 RepID=A0AAV7UBW2_PLEWA|nr:hypothetical protein NDU88_002276 [Pleurodeles waltl]